MLVSVGFVGLIWLTGELWLSPPEFAAKQPAAIIERMWYPWQMAEPTVWTRLSAWGFYSVHQIIIWYLIWKATHSEATYSANLHWFNIAALATNAVFILLHLLQTHIWYDGLAQDVPEVTSQASVVLMLAGMLIIENQRRGLFFGKPVPYLADRHPGPSASTMATTSRGPSCTPSGITRWSTTRGTCWASCICSC